MARIAEEGVLSNCVDALLRVGEQSVDFGDALLIADWVNAVGVAPGNDDGLGDCQFALQNPVIFGTDCILKADCVEDFGIGRAQCKEVEIGDDAVTMLARPGFNFAGRLVAAIGIGSGGIFENQGEGLGCGLIWAKGNSQQIAVTQTG